MALFEIHPKDYTDLSETLSEKNVINTIYGKEYVVTNLSETQLNEIIINPETPSQIFSTYNGVRWLDAKNNTNIRANFKDAWLKNIFGMTIDEGFPRAEALFFVGTHEFDTEEVLADIDSVACKFTINYTKSNTNSITAANQKTIAKTAFWDYPFQFPVLENEYDNNLTLEENKFLPAEDGVEVVSALFRSETYVASAPYNQEYCKVDKVIKTSTGYHIKIKYCFRIWGAWTTDNNSNNKALSVNYINIKTVANTVDVEELPFEYQKNLTSTEREYELETNELFQTTLDDSDEEKLSYQTYEKIVNAYDTDRRIITFDLLNPLKAQINDGEKFEGGNEKVRYLDTDDEFNIYDEHNKFMGTFKVLQSNPIWDGAYHKRITAILVD